LEQVDLSNVNGLVFTDKWKQEILTYLKSLTEQRNLGIVPDDSALISQMNEQQFEYTQPKTARGHVHMKFRHPLRRHDDQLFALALACYASKEEGPFIAVLPMS
jgi:phage FluMu gp28-like protein